MGKLRINLDDIGDEFPNSKFDIGGEGHAIVIDAENKDKFITEMKEWFGRFVNDNLEEE